MRSGTSALDLLPIGIRNGIVKLLFGFVVVIARLNCAVASQPALGASATSNGTEFAAEVRATIAGHAAAGWLTVTPGVLELRTPVIPSLAVRCGLRSSSVSLIVSP